MRGIEGIRKGGRKVGGKLWVCSVLEVKWRNRNKEERVVNWMKCCWVDWLLDLVVCGVVLVEWLGCKLDWNGFKGKWEKRNWE